MNYFIIAICIVLLALVALQAYYLYKFVMIIIVCENDYSEIIEALFIAENKIDKVINTQIFFDSEEIKPVVDAAMQEVRAARIIVRKSAERFVEHSKQKYTLYEEDSEMVQNLNHVNDQRRFEPTFIGLPKSFQQDEMIAEMRNHYMKNSINRTK